MYNVEQLASSRVSAVAPLTLPVDVLLTVPTAPPHFNLVGAMGELLQRFSWERSSRILSPRLWAPGWDQEELTGFLSYPIAGFTRSFRVPASTMTTTELLGLDPHTLSLDPIEQVDAVNRLLAEYEPLLEGLNLPVADRPAPIYRPRYDVVQLFAHFDGDGRLVLADDQRLDPLLLESLLRWAGTRLLILHLPHADRSEAEARARAFVAGGLPAALLVSAGNQEAIDRYYFDLYAAVVHNRWLDEVAEPRSDPAEIDALLVRALDAGDVLQMHYWLEELRSRFDALQQDAQARRSDIESLRLRARQLPGPAATRFDRFVTYGPAQFAEAEPQTSLDELETRIERGADVLRSDIDWAHESGGAEPLSRIADAVLHLESDARRMEAMYDSMERTLETMESAAAAPPAAAPEAGLEKLPAPAAVRVLNGYFRDEETGESLGSHTSLQSGHNYSLLVQVAPPVPESIVTGEKVFPDEHLPDQTGYEVDVVLVSEDLEPATMAGRMWVPGDGGASYPIVDDERARHPGPLALGFAAPPLAGQAERRIDGRLSLYFANNLLQSAAVSAHVTTRAVNLDEPNRVHVDYRLSTTLTGLVETYGTRALHIAEGDSGSHPVALNIALNDSGGKHRILVKDRKELAPAWTPYDPEDARADLEEARKALVECFEGLDGNNGKKRAGFYDDLGRLARIGNDLFAKFTTLVQPADASLARSWMAKLRESLAEGAVVQAARAGSTPVHHVIPWGLFYDYRLSGDRPLRWCDVIEEQWSPDGIRQAPAGSRCPYDRENWHRTHVLCPYGFWGLKHIVEQPLSPIGAGNGALPGRDLVDVVNRVPVTGDIALAMARTADEALDKAALEGHVADLSALAGIRLARPDPNPAFATGGLPNLLDDASFVYLLCHGEYDEESNEPYLGIGLRDNRLEHKIYSGTLLSWTDTGLQNWITQRPVVFINGCETSKLSPGEVLNLASAFTYAGASGVVGTEISVQLTLATEVGHRIAARLTGGEPLGQALRQTRWELANKGNLLGLAYTAYGLADLRFEVS